MQLQLNSGDVVRQKAFKAFIPNRGVIDVRATGGRHFIMLLLGQAKNDNPMPVSWRSILESWGFVPVSVIEEAHKRGEVQKLIDEVKARNTPPPAEGISHESKV